MVKKPGTRCKKLFPVIGGIIGLLVWGWDYDFFLNPGGPSTPVSNAILRIFHLQTMEYPIPVFLPLFVLVIAGVGIAAVAMKVTRRSTNGSGT